MQETIQLVTSFTLLLEYWSTVPKIAPTCLQPIAVYEDTCIPVSKAWQSSITYLQPTLIPFNCASPFLDAHSRLSSEPTLRHLVGNLNQQKRARAFL